MRWVCVMSLLNVGIVVSSYSTARVHHNGEELVDIGSLKYHNTSMMIMHTYHI